MFSALRKLVATEAVQDGTRGDVPDGMRTMGQNLQRKFAKGVQYNMKVIIKGDRNTGKTTLFRRLQGEKFKEEYIPTPEIQVESIQWGYKATDDVVKVEVWDVVDRGKTRKQSESLKLENEAEEDDTPCLDASFLDVYKGTHGVVMMMDITKQWTWQYVERELPKVPDHIPVLVLGNMRDMGPHRTVDEEDTRFYIEHFQRPEGSAPVMYAESSMRNGFGLRYLHTFFNIPYLQLQRETLLIQLKTNKLELKATQEELQLRKESEDQSYELYLQGLESKRSQKRKKAPPSSPQSLPVPNGQPQQAAPSSSSSSTPARLSPAVTPPPARREVPVAKAAEPSPPQVEPSPEAPAPSLSQKFSRWFGSGEARADPGKNEEASIEPPAKVLNNGNTTITSVEDFVPDEGIDRSFFEDEPPSKNKRKGKKEKKSPVVQPPPEPEGSSDSEVGENPMVAGFQEELDSEDEGPSIEGSTGVAEPTQAAAKKVSSREIELSSDSEPEAPVIKADEDSDSSDDKQSKSTPEVYDADKSETSPTADSKEQSQVPKLGKPKKAAKLKLSMDATDSAIIKGEEKSSSSDPESVKTPSSAGIQLQLEDLNFLESVTSKSSTTSSSKKSSSLQPQPNSEFDALVNINDEEPSDTETSTTTTSTTSSAKKKKHRTKERKDKDEEKSHRKHKHKKHKEKESKEEGGSRKEEKTEKKKKKKSKKREEPDETQKEMDDLEMFLEGGDPVGYEAI